MGTHGSSPRAWPSHLVQLSQCCIVKTHDDSENRPVATRINARSQSKVEQSRSHVGTWVLRLKEPAHTHGGTGQHHPQPRTFSCHRTATHSRSTSTSHQSIRRHRLKPSRSRAEAESLGGKQVGILSSVSFISPTLLPFRLRNLAPVCSFVARVPRLVFNGFKQFGPHRLLQPRHPHLPRPLHHLCKSSKWKTTPARVHQGLQSGLRTISMLPYARYEIRSLLRKSTSPCILWKMARRSTLSNGCARVRESLSGVWLWTELVLMSFPRCASTSLQRAF